MVDCVIGQVAQREGLGIDFFALRAPFLGKGLGQSIRNFKSGLSSGEKEEKDA